MHSHLTDSLVKHLAHEEVLLRSALAGAAGVYDSLRKGDLPAALNAPQHTIADDLRDAAAARAAAAVALAHAVGVPAENLTLTALAAKLPAPQATELLAAKGRLSALAADVQEIQARNANLVGHLRSFFRGVLSDLTPAAPARYGSGGRRLDATGG